MSDIKDYKCPACGAPMRFDVNTQKMVCSFCANTYDIEYIRSHFNEVTSERSDDFDWIERTKNDAESSKTQKLVEYSCPSCGGSIITFSKRTKAKCPFCNNDLVVSAGFKGDIRPDKVIPFSKTRKDFADEYRRQLSVLQIVPNEFNDKDIEKRIVGRYIPIWIYSCSCKVTLADKSTQEFKIKDYPIPGDKFNKAIFYEIEPFNYDEAEDFTESCLIGFYASKYTIRAENAKQHADNEIIYYASWDTNYHKKENNFRRSVKNNCTISEHKILYYLVPVWMLEINYKDHIYTFAMNGQTGEFFGGELFLSFQNELAKRGYIPPDKDKAGKTSHKYKFTFISALVIALILFFLFCKITVFTHDPFFISFFIFLVILALSIFSGDSSYLINKDPFRYIRPPCLCTKKRSIEDFICDEKKTMPDPVSDSKFTE